MKNIKHVWSQLGGKLEKDEETNKDVRGNLKAAISKDLWGRSANEVVLIRDQHLAMVKAFRKRQNTKLSTIPS